jgi:hypothetical protein
LAGAIAIYLIIKMPTITVYALEAAIQVLNEKIFALKSHIDQQHDDADVSDLEEEIMGWMKAAASLKNSHKQAVVEGYDIMPYEKLVG